MAKRLLKEAERNFEPLHIEPPVVVLDDHPDGGFIAMRVTGRTDLGGERAAIWSTKDRKIVWAPEDVNAICWTSNGKELLLVRELYQPQPEKHKIIVTPLQDEFSYSFERRSWPERELIAQCPIGVPTGWIVDLVASPTGTLACFVWNDQHEAGIELVSIVGKETHVCHGQGYYGEDSNLLEGPVFSAEGRYLVFTYTKYAWWSPDDPETPSLGGRCKVGWIVVGDVAAGKYRVVEVYTVPSKGWLPPDPNDFCSVLLSPPSFTDRDHFKVVLPTGEEQSFPVSAKIE